MISTINLVSETSWSEFQKIKETEYRLTNSKSKPPLRGRCIKCCCVLEFSGLNLLTQFLSNVGAFFISVVAPSNKNGNILWNALSSPHFLFDLNERIWFYLFCLYCQFEFLSFVKSDQDSHFQMEIEDEVGTSPLHLIAGAVAGTVEHCGMYPIDTIKVVSKWTDLVFSSLVSWDQSKIA